MFLGALYLLPCHFVILLGNEGAWIWNMSVYLAFYDLMLVFNLDDMLQFCGNCIAVVLFLTSSSFSFESAP